VFFQVWPEGENAAARCRHSTRALSFAATHAVSFALRVPSECWLLWSLTCPLLSLWHTNIAGMPQHPGTMPPAPCPLSLRPWVPPVFYRS